MEQSCTSDAYRRLSSSLLMTGMPHRILVLNPFPQGGEEDEDDRFRRCGVVSMPFHLFATMSHLKSFSNDTTRQPEGIACAIFMAE